MATHKKSNQKSREHAEQAGFTIIELLIATLVFSLILFALTYGLLQITNNYYDGIVLDKTRNATNGVIDNISQGLQLDGPYLSLGSITSPSHPGVTIAGFCIGQVEYSYLIGYELASTFDSVNLTSPQVFVENTDADCNQSTTIEDVAAGGQAGVELMAPETRLIAFSIAPENALDGLSPYQVTVTALYGNTSAIAGEPSGPPYTLPGPTAACSGGFGLQFCAISEISTYVVQRAP
jgi:prepilin-type N-terminal cleavage/methylation domain-containing protein